MHVYLDIETRSRADLPSVGEHRYGLDSTTEVLMAAVSGPNPDDPVRLWINPKYDIHHQCEPEALVLLEQADTVYAHSAPFEEAVLSGTNFSPYVAIDKWRCTKAMARMAGLPDSLEKCAQSLPKVKYHKTVRGRTLIQLFSIPQKDGRFIQPSERPDEWLEFCEYCRQDVRVERAIHHELRGAFELTGDNLETFRFTMRMNAYGIPVNVSALQNAQEIIRQVEEESGKEFRDLVGLKITQRAKVRRWLADRRLPLPDMQSTTLDAIPEDDIPPGLRRPLKLYKQLSYAATKKVRTMLDWVCPDGRIRGTFRFYGAGTGRWAATGPQFHNIKRPTPAMRPLIKGAYKYICDGGTKEGIEAVYGSPLEVISSCMRQFVHVPGRQMFDADYNAVEARIVCWAAGEERMLDMWRTGRDLYRHMAATIFGVPEDTIGADSEERRLGKQAILGCGYGMGWKKFMETCATYGVPCTEELAQRAVATYRKTYWRVTELWAMLGRHAEVTVMTSSPAGQFSMRYCGGIPFLTMRLPSGRSLAYPYPEMTYVGGFHDLTYWGAIPGTTTWGRVKLYGGKLTENLVQGIAADLMSYGARRAEAQWMIPFALIHDQALAMREQGQEAEDFAAALNSLPHWASGLPLKCEAKIVDYYSK